MNASWPVFLSSSIARRAVAVTALLLVSACLYIDATTLHMRPGIGPCVSGLGVWLLPLGVGIAAAAGPVEGLLSMALAVLAVYVAFRRRSRKRLVEKA